MLDFNQATKGKTSAFGKNVLNLPYTYSEEEVEFMEEQMSEQASLEETTPRVQSSEHEAPDFQAPEEAPFSLEAQDLEAP